MPRVSAAFFGVGVLYVLIGMFYGMYMGATNDMTLAPAHAHLNLLGWVTMALYGSFYAFTAETMSVRLAWTNFTVSAVGVLVLIPALAMFLASGQDPKYVPALMAGEILTVLGMFVFGISVVHELTRKRSAV